MKVLLAEVLAAVEWFENQRFLKNIFFMFKNKEIENLIF